MHKPSPYWVVTQDEDGSWHLKPDRDLYDHEWEDCLCGVKLQEIERDEDGTLLLFVHSSLDGREAFAKGT